LRDSLFTLLRATSNNRESEEEIKMSYQKYIQDLQNDNDVLEERMERLEEIASILIIVLRSQPCRCQMKGGPMWHLKAQMQISFTCSRCKAIECYEEFLKAEGTSSPSTADREVPTKS
jgi:hypothetical protein